MGVNNHLIIPENGADLDIYFSYGEVREYVYRIGDELFFKASDVSPRTTIIPGIFYNIDKSQNGNFMHDRFFKISLKNGIFSDCDEVSEEAYKRIPDTPRY